MQSTARKAKKETLIGRNTLNGRQATPRNEAPFNRHFNLRVMVVTTLCRKPKHPKHFNSFKLMYRSRIIYVPCFYPEVAPATYRVT